MKPLSIAAFTAASLFILSACSGDPEASYDTGGAPEAETTAFADVSDDRLNNAAATPAEWLGYGFDREETRHSPLTGSTKDNVGELGVAWTYDLATSRGVESTPIVIDGVMYVTSAWMASSQLMMRQPAKSFGSMTRMWIARWASMRAAMS